jgi:hypothetical protein
MPSTNDLFRACSKFDVTAGRLDNPKVSAMEAIARLVENAFFKAILPGFDREVILSGGPRPPQGG